MSTLLPLFPLDLVLLPGTPLPLHIFEPRYREMISECLERSQQFGVIRGKEQELAEIGCTAEILTVTKKYDDGRMDIVTEGRARFEVMQLNQERSFLQAEVLYLNDGPDIPSQDEIAQAMNLHGEIMTLAGAEPEKTSEMSEALALVSSRGIATPGSRLQTNLARHEIRVRTPSRRYFFLRNHPAGDAPHHPCPPQSRWQWARRLTLEAGV